jgi:hypothetical protein
LSAEVVVTTFDPLLSCLGDKGFDGSAPGLLLSESGAPVETTRFPHVGESTRTVSPVQLKADSRGHCTLALFVGKRPKVSQIRMFRNRALRADPEPGDRRYGDQLGGEDTRCPKRRFGITGVSCECYSGNLSKAPRGLICRIQRLRGSDSLHRRRAWKQGMAAMASSSHFVAGSSDYVLFISITVPGFSPCHCGHS